jgi:hypothetical protein
MKSKTPYFLLLIAAILYNIWLMGKEKEEKQNLKASTEISTPTINQSQSK